MNRSTGIVISIATSIAFGLGCSKSEPTPEAAAPVATTTPAPRLDALPPEDDAPTKDESKLTITVEPPRAPGSALAKRCALGGDPIAGDCSRSSALAFDRSGALYLVDGPDVRRYKRASGDDCRFEPAGASIPLPPENKRPQRLDKGPIYMRSGGPAWRLVGGDTVYAVDFLGGLFRVDRGKSEPVCADVFGYDSVASLGGKLVIARHGIERLVPAGKTCTASDAGIDAKAHGNVYALRDHLYVASGGGPIARYDGATRVELGEGARVCSVAGFVPCGDGGCIVDTNCSQVIQLGKDDKVVRTLESRKLFDTHPYGLLGAAAQGGDVYVLARHRDHDVCELAVYRLPSALFAL